MKSVRISQNGPESGLREALRRILCLSSGRVSSSTLRGRRFEVSGLLIKEMSETLSQKQIR